MYIYLGAIYFIISLIMYLAFKEGDNISGIADEIKSRVNIVDVIGQTVQLKKSGNRWVGLCPFHKEKTPSFFVNEDMQNFKCFGCGASGDVISYVERKNNLSFMEAAEKLASEFGFELPKGTFDTDSKKTLLYDANRMAAAFFHNEIRKSGNAGLKYMLNRGISADTITKFGIGYADSKWESLYEHLIKNGVSLDTAKEVGLISSKNGRNYDRYVDRVMFPIINTRSKVIGFGGRTIGSDDPRKYLNSSESRAFHKGNNLYGINITRDEIKNKDYSILVEGYMDAVSLYQNGVKNVVAALGTALTPNQGNLLKRFSENVVVAYDSDTAGQDATLRNIDILRKTGCKVRVLNLGDMKDPDEYIKKYGRDVFLQAVDDSEPFMSYKLSQIKSKYDLNTEDGSVGFLKEAARTISELSPVEADFYIKKLANENDISEDAIKSEAFGKSGKKNNNTSLGNTDRNKSEEESITEIIERNLIRLLLHNSGFLRRVKENEYERVFKTPVYYRIYETINSIYKEDIEISIEELTEILEGEDADTVLEIMKSVPLGKDPSGQLEELLTEIEFIRLEKREREILSILKEDHEETVSRTDELAQELLSIQRKKKELKDW